MSFSNKFNIDNYTACMEEPLLDFVFWYNDTKQLYIQYGKTLCEHYPIIGYIVDVVLILSELFVAFIQSIYTRTTHLYIEPSGNWISLIAIHNSEPNVYENHNYHFVEKYVYPVEKCTTPDSRMAVFFSYAQNTFVADKNVYEILITLKESHDYFVRTCNDSNTVYRPITIPSEKSDVEFLCVEYTHPEMKSAIPITIPASYFCVGNELFSMAFVRRMLEYKSLFTTFVFDEKYVVTMIDMSIVQHRLSCRNYIVLEKDTFRIVEMP